METWVLGKKVSLGGPQTTLLNDDLHAFEPARHGGVVLREIKQLGLAIWECAAAHAWTIRLVHPPFSRPCERKLAGAGEGMSAFHLYWLLGFASAKGACCKWQ